MVGFEAHADDATDISAVAVPVKSMHVSAGERAELTLDVRNRIASARGAWKEVLRQESAGVLDIESCIDRPLWDWVSGAQVRQLWEILFERVRASGAPLFVPKRADMPGMRRVWDVEIHPLPERGLQLIAHCVWTERRIDIALLDPAFPRSSESLAFCAWCNRIQVGFGIWEEIEDAQFTLRIDASESLPSLERVACGTCKQSLLKTFPARVA